MTTFPVTRGSVIRSAAALLLGLALVAASAHAQAGGRGGAAAPKPVADSLSLQPAVRQSWTSDKTRFGIGDIVSIVITERTLASANLNDIATATRKKELGLDFTPPASPTGPATSIDATADFKNNGDSRTRGQAVRETDFRSLISARVIGVSPTGMLQIRGHKLVTVDKNEQDVTVTGWIRPQDIVLGSNTIESARIADAEITYGQKGSLGKPKSGIVGRIIGMLWP